MSEPAKGSASETAWAWLDGVVSNTGDPEANRSLWAMTHEILRAKVLGELGLDTDMAGEDDISWFEDWQELAQRFVTKVRDLLSQHLQALGVGDEIGTTGLEVPQSVDCVACVFSEAQIAPGRYEIPIGARIGFAVSVFHDPNTRLWYVVDIKHDYYTDGSEWPISTLGA